MSTTHPVKWDDERSALVMLEGLSATTGGDGNSGGPAFGFWDPSQKPQIASSEDDEFEGADLDESWIKTGTWELGGVARGDSFTTPADTVRYDVNTSRKSHLVMQGVSDPMQTIGQGIRRVLKAENLDAGSSPTNWQMLWGFVREVDVSSLPVSDNDGVALILMGDNDGSDNLDFGKFVGFSIVTDYTNADLPVKVQMVYAYPPEDVDPVGTPLLLPAIPSFDALEIHKVGTEYRGYCVKGGNRVELGVIDLPGLNPTVYGLWSVISDTPNPIIFIDYVRHSFTAAKAD